MLESSNSTLETYVSAVLDCRDHLNTAVHQCKKLSNLSRRSKRIAVQCAKILFDAHLNGFEIPVPQGFWQSFKSLKPSDRSSDDIFLAVWYDILLILQSKSKTAKGEAGSFNVPNVVLNEYGRPVDKHGKLLSSVDIVDPDSGKKIGQKLNAPVKTELDDYDDEDKLEYLRNRVLDWADICSTASSLLSALKENVNVIQYDESQVKARSKSGAVILFDLASAPIVNGIKVAPLSAARYNIVLTLLNAKRRMSSTELELRSGHSEARRRLAELLQKDNWNEVIQMSGKERLGYGIK